MPQTRTIKTGKLFRTFNLDRAAVDTENRTIPLSFSSEAPVERWFGNEILDHSKKAVRLDRLKTGGPLLVDHNSEDQVGVIEQVSIGTDRKGQAVVRFGKSARAAEIYQDVLDGIRQNVSVGYRIHSMILEEEKKDGPSTYRANDWEPYEVSIVSIPADTSVGVGRAEEGEEKEIQIILKEERRMETSATSTPAAPAVDINAVREAVRKEESTRANEILAIGDQHEMREMASEFVRAGKSIEDFRSAVLEKKYKAKPIVTPDAGADIGMSDKEKKRYSIVNAIRQMADAGRLEGIEKEASEATAKQCGRQAKGFFIPNDVMTAKRALTAATATSGGFTVDNDTLGGSMIELLRNKTMVAQLGATSLSGLVGNVLIPRVTGGGTAYWLPENGSVTASTQAFGQLALTPHRLVGDTAYSKELLNQSSIDIEAFVKNDLMRVLALEKDRAALNGLGAAGEPLGIMNTTGIKTVTFGAAATFAKVIDFETQIAATNADVASMAFLTTPAVRGKWKGTAKVSSYPSFLWENGAQPGSGLANGYRAEATLQVPSDKVVFGNWSDLIQADWAGIDVVVDPYSLKKTGQVEVTVTLWTDIGVRHAVSFCVSTDSGAQ